MVELVNALGAALHIGDWFCFWIKYEAPTADRGSNGAPERIEGVENRSLLVADHPHFLCPCGAGKKFKRSHGAPETLH
jgi:hypothetical protein